MLAPSELVSVEIQSGIHAIHARADALLSQDVHAHSNHSEGLRNVLQTLRKMAAERADQELAGAFQ